MPYGLGGGLSSGGLQGLQGAFGGLSPESEFRHRAELARIRMAAFQTQDTPSYLELSNIPKTIREELQSEVDEWLKDIDI